VFSKRGRFTAQTSKGHSLEHPDGSFHSTGVEKPRLALSNPPTAVDSSKQFVDDFCCDPLIVKVWAGYVPPSHGTVQSDQPRDTVPPKVPRPKIARVVRGPRVVCSSAVRS